MEASLAPVLHAPGMSGTGAISSPIDMNCPIMCRVATQANIGDVQNIHITLEHDGKQTPACSWHFSFWVVQKVGDVRSLLTSGVKLVTQYIAARCTLQELGEVCDADALCPSHSMQP